MGCGASAKNSSAKNSSEKERGGVISDRLEALALNETSDDLDTGLERRDKVSTAGSTGSKPTTLPSTSTEDADLSVPTARHREDIEDDRIASKSESCRSTDTYLVMWTHATETLLLLDWDDTCFPTSAIGSAALQTDPGWWKDSADFHEFCDTTYYLLRDAASVCTVKILTMATAVWLDSCFAKIRMIRPDFDSILPEIVYARDYMSPGIKGDCRDVSHYLKTQAMSNVIEDFYKSPRPDSTHRKRSWKNIMSIGDSEAERLALQDVAFRHQQRSRNGRWKDYRYKTLMLRPNPSITLLTEELRAVKRWLPSICHHDGDLDIDFDSANLTLIGEGLPCSNGVNQHPINDE